MRAHKEDIVPVAFLVSMPLLTWGIGEITGDVAIQRLLPKITLATVAGLVLSVPLAYFSARAVQRKYNLFNKD